MSGAIRVRFAPSPTGALHIGGVRTALYNYLFARQQGGTFILRIEDTDQKRYVPGAEAYIIEALEWLGLEFDESPAKGGEYGPYRQSERKAMYGEFAEKLIENGWGYYAFDTEDELTQKRAKLEAQGQVFKYDASTRLDMNNSLSMPEAAWKQKIADGVPYVVRLMVPLDYGLVIFDDEVRGQITFNSTELDDKVMLKADGMPTYHLANIVDDYHMKISHVIRGEEWLPSTPIHVLLYEALGWKADMPKFAHLPLILKPEPTTYISKRTVNTFTDKFTKEFVKKYPETENKAPKIEGTIRTILQDIKNLANHLKQEDGEPKLNANIKAFLKSAMKGKLSKRDGDRLGMPVFPLDWNGATADDNFKGFREWGFLPSAVLNLLALLGWNSGDEQELFTLDELVQKFSFARVSKSGAQFNYEKAKWYNQQYIINSENATLLEFIRPIFKDKEQDLSEEALLGVAQLLKQRVNFLPEFHEQSAFLFQSLDLEALKEKEGKNLRKKVFNKWADSKESCQTLKTMLSSIDSFEADNIKTELEKSIEQNGFEKRLILPILRYAISGKGGGPELDGIMALLGKNETLTRLNNFFEFCDKELETV
ncbi:MAG: glutamate--tRNA ligase [Aureispira sp.]|nr:glutamate--tRNA ligase [Aureispira sp.]